MGVSSNIISISKVQGDSEFLSIISELNSYKTPSNSYIESDARYPSLNEIYKSLEKAGIKILNERIEKDEVKYKDGEDFTVHVFDMTDEEVDSNEDFTVKYKTGISKNESVYSMMGIKTHNRILIKLVVQLTSFCGSFYIVNPYESFFIEKGVSYEEIWNDINNKS